MNTKPESNTEALESLKNQGFKVKIQHFRNISKGRKQDIVPENEWRNFVWESNEICPKGGATEIKLERSSDETNIVVRSECYVKDSFCRKIGVFQCLMKLKRLYGIWGPSFANFHLNHSRLKESPLKLRAAIIRRNYY